MSKNRIDPLAGTWSEAIAALSKRPVEEVADFLERRDLRPQALIPRPVDLTIRSVSFSGEKSLSGRREPFDFTWGGLGPGLWLIGSEGTSRGKTSLLGVMRWLLRGSRPAQIPGGVVKWIHRASMDFQLGEIQHRVSIELRDGFTAELSELHGGEPKASLMTAASPDEFEHGMSDFMMSRLGLEPIVGMRDGEPSVHHRWPSLFAAFHMGTEYSAILGDTPLDGLANRLLNMFCGFCHASAVARIQNIITSLGAEQDKEDQAARAVAAHIKTRLLRLRAELEALPTPPCGASSAVELLEGVRSAADELTVAYDRAAELRRVRNEALESSLVARTEMNADKLALQDFKEARAAERVFRRLTPTCCPRCDQAFGDERKEREATARACMVCGGEAPTENSADVEDALATLEGNAWLSENAYAEAYAERNRAIDEVAQAEAEVSRLEALLRTRREQQAEGSLLDAYGPQRAVLEAMIAEAERDLGSPTERQESPETAIAKACERVFRERLKAEQAEVLGDVEQETFKLLRAFGVTNLERIRLTANPHLYLVKDDPDDEGTPFSRSSIGDKLRSKIALVVALMKVAQRRGVGRHPGILFIDTPGAQEMTAADLEQMAQGLAALRDELPTLQIFVGTARVSEFEATVPEEFRLVATGGDMIW
ncbi:hypothetical protein GBZ26_11370 [Azospirillum formosense]|uniref:Rad50/SbcC-type AAA domain-containing protein n=1 Tax=Azospirillum formosense TaxID=861533 RepID=A0ABX2KT39_9PROT|nr:hypothetical protein [Azospirillum formosense]MBY3755525.1 hypothetical protein [Azospirillum formosense]NUB19811.1 hypothetical protein [Azospirillum formosense]